MNMKKPMIDQAPERASTAGSTMDVNAGLSLRVAQLQVLSRTLAHLSHDVQNHLAIISESAGWMEDLLKLKSKQRFGWLGRLLKRGRSQRLDVEPFLSGLSIIRKQIKEGSTLTERFNSFAHRLEETRAVFDANKVLVESQDVLSRQAGEKGICLELELTKEAPMIETDPPGFQLAVLGTVKHVMEGLKSGDCLALEAGISGGRFQVCLTGPYHEGFHSLSLEEPDSQDFYRDIVEYLGGQIQRESGDGKYVTTLTFPLATAEA